MKLFSEKVEPTFTSSNLNILGVRNFKEIFVDVFEFEINGKKFIAEKVSENNGAPVVDIPVVLEGKEYIAPFVLRKGNIEILFNRENSTFVRTILEDVQELIEQYTDDEQERITSLIKTSINELSTKLTSDLNKKTKSVEDLVNEKIINLTTNTIPNIFLKGSHIGDSSVLDNVKEKLELIDKAITESEINKEDIYENLKNISDETVQLAERIDKSSNRALSRIGNIKVQLEDAVTDVATKVKLVEEKIGLYYDDKISTIENTVKELTNENKKYFIELINDSKQSLLQEVSKIKNDVPNIVIENVDGKQEVNVKGIKDELEKIIGTKFTTEIAALKRLIELSSGGGSVAKQFANGGTMEGTLNVTGQYLSGGVDLLTIFSSGGDDIAVNTVVRSSSANWNSAYTTGTVYQVNSASYATIDFTNSKFFPLTGGTITGATVINNNLTVNGNLTATGTTTFNNTVFSVTSALSVVHVGEGPAVWIGNSGLGDIASFNDIDTGLEVLHIGGSNGSFPNVGVKTSTPNKTLTVSGEISATSDITTSGKIYIQNDGNSDQWNSAYNLVSGNNLVYTTGDQNIGGSKTFLQNIVGNGIDNRLPNQQLNSSDAILTLKVFEDKLDWNYLPFASTQSLLSGSATNSTAVGAISQDTASTAGTNYAFIRQSGPFNRSPLSWIGSTITDTSQAIPFASKRTKIKVNVDPVTLTGNAFIWFGIWEKLAVPLTVLDNRGFGAKITPTSIEAEVHDGTTLTTGASSVFTDTGPFDLEVDYYQRFCTVSKNGTIVATVSGGYNINATASLIFYAYAVNGTTDRSRVEYKNLRYKITDS